MMDDFDNFEYEDTDSDEVAFDDGPWIRKGRKGTRYMLGHTIAGRYLFVIYVLQSKGVARVITSMDMDDKTRKL